MVALVFCDRQNYGKKSKRPKKKVKNFTFSPFSQYYAYKNIIQSGVKTFSCHTI